MNPLAVPGTNKESRQHGLPEAVILGLLNQFCAGVSEREDKVGR